jgi:hypothetical protein
LLEQEFVHDHLGTRLLEGGEKLNTSREPDYHTFSPALYRGRWKKLGQQEKRGKNERKRRRQQGFNLVVLAIALIIIVFITVYSLSNPTSVQLPSYLNQCLPSVGKPVYISTPQIVIRINGVAQNIPTNIGVLRSCVRPISTRSGVGIIHIDAFDNVTYHLGDFFLIWGNTYGAQFATFNSQQIFNYRTDPSSNHTLTLTINNVADTRFQDYPFPTNANFTSPSSAVNIAITYG